MQSRSTRSDRGEAIGEIAGKTFCTIDPNVGVVAVPDARLEWLRDLRAGPSLRVMGLLLPFSCLCGIMTGYYTACSRIRQLVGIALIVILPRFLGVDGVWITFPAIDLVGGLAAALLLRREARNLHRTKNCGVGIKASAAHTPNP